MRVGKLRRLRPDEGEEARVAQHAAEELLRREEIAPRGDGRRRSGARRSLLGAVGDVLLEPEGEPALREAEAMGDLADDQLTTDRRLEARDVDQELLAGLREDVRPRAPSACAREDPPAQEIEELLARPDGREERLASAPHDEVRGVEIVGERGDPDLEPLVEEDSDPPLRRAQPRRV